MITLHKLEERKRSWEQPLSGWLADHAPRIIAELEKEITEMKARGGE